MPRLRPLVLLSLLAVACRGEAVEERPPGATSDTSPRAEIDTTGAAPAALDSAARRVVAALRGEMPLADVRVADTVVLLVSPEGGGGRVVRTREQLRRTEGWAVPVGGQSRSLVPPRGLTKLTTSVGRHRNCLEYALATRVPDLAPLPHVGVTLAPPGDGSSCLATWNATLVFAADARPPTLVAVVYDQWEW